MKPFGGDGHQQLVLQRLCRIVLWELDVVCASVDRREEVLLTSFIRGLAYNCHAGMEIADAAWR